MHGGNGFVKSWQDHFETEDREEVEGYLEVGGILWHWSALGARGASLLRVMGPERLPTNACYGDGEPIPVEHVDAMRETRRREAARFQCRILVAMA